MSEPLEFPGVEVFLTQSELIMAATTGALRHHEAVAAGRKDKHGFTDHQSGIGIHIQGAAGELAVAKVWNVHFPGHVNNFKEPDLGSRTQVRSRSEHNYELIVRKDDNKDHIYVLVTGEAPQLFVRGWMYGHEAKNKEFLASHGGREAAYFVPTELLHPMDEFPE